MSKKKYEDDPLTGWDVLILVILGGIVVTTTLAFAIGLSWWWPVTYLVALFLAVPASINNDRKKEAEKAND